MLKLTKRRVLRVSEMLCAGGVVVVDIDKLSLKTENELLASTFRSLQWNDWSNTQQKWSSC